MVYLESYENLKRDELYDLLSKNNDKISQLKKNTTEIQKFIDYTYREEIDALPDEMSKLTPEQIKLVFDTKIKDGKLQHQLEEKKQKYLSVFHYLNFTDASKKETFYPIFDLLNSRYKSRDLKFPQIDLSNPDSLAKLIMDVDVLFTLLPNVMFKFTFRNPKDKDTFYNPSGMVTEFVVRKLGNKLYISGWDYSRVYYTVDKPILVFKRFVEGVINGAYVIDNLNLLVPNKKYILNRNVFANKKGSEGFYGSDVWIFVCKKKGKIGGDDEYVFKKNSTTNISLVLNDKMYSRSIKFTNGEAYSTIGENEKLTVAIQLP